MKGAQTCFLFLLVSLRQRVSVVGPEGPALLAAGEALFSLIEVWKRAGARLSAQEIQATVDYWVTFLRLTSPFEDMAFPKRHVVSHLVTKASFFGNPNLYSNWEDESLNRLLKAACRKVSQRTFEGFLLMRFQMLPHRCGVKRPAEP